MRVLLVIPLLALCIGCVHRPGQSWPWVAESFAEGDVVYNGVGFKF